MRTIAEHISLMQHAVGATPDSRHDLYETLNRAGRILTRVRAWWWRLVPAYSLAAVSGSADITLPSDFQTLDTITLSGGNGRVVCLTPDQFTKEKAGDPELATIGLVKVLLPVMTYHATTGAETKVLRMLNTATANGSPTFLMTYYRGWVDVDSGDDAAVASIPPDFDDALMLLARACARGMQDDLAPEATPDYAAFLAELRQLETEDTRRVPEFLPATGGAMSRPRRMDLIGEVTF